MPRLPLGKQQGGWQALPPENRERIDNLTRRIAAHNLKVRRPACRNRAANHLRYRLLTNSSLVPARNLAYIQITDG
ncbi:hypothetical protein SBA3_2300017 [Candidatus Sulfopaludibacter sp. SbA3]|nr:hypothetical protein SBA3_2300017 [Candidatus Sulfopaludibacter sp. SbA3]